MAERDPHRFPSITESNDDYALRIQLLKDAEVLEDIDPACCDECDEQYAYMLARIECLVLRLQELNRIKETPDA